MSGVHDQFHKTLAERREQRSAGRARKSVLEDLESRQEGLGIGVKEILSRARTGGTPPWDKVLGSVSELLEVDLEQAALVGNRAGPPRSGHRHRRPRSLGGLSEPRDGADCRPRRVCRASREPRGNENRTECRGPPQPLLGEPRTRSGVAARFERAFRGVQCRADSMLRASDQAPALAEQLCATRGSSTRSTRLSGWPPKRDAAAALSRCKASCSMRTAP